MSDRDHGNGGVLTDDLTWREQEVLSLLCDRLTNREIAQQLHLAESTVKDYVSSILSKLYVKNRREAVEKAKTLKLLGRDKAVPADRKSNIPPEKTPFIGREAEISQIIGELASTRLLSLIGPGGIGKTRLALKVAERSINNFSDGVYFVRLAPLRESRDIILTIAENLRIPVATQEDPQIQLVRFLKSRNILLILDNFEHLMNGAGILREILQEAPGVRIIVTSRERLNFQAESIHQVGGLAFPSQAGAPETLGFDAIALFTQRASKVRPGYDPSQDEIAHIVKICQIVGGMPLAIELAAAWLHLLNINEIVAELEKDINILVTEARDTPDRHRSIRAVFDSSWSLLEPSEQDLFMRLSVFRGGFTRKAAQQVTDASLIQLAGLADKSFVNLDTESGRLEVHELLRQYAQEKLEDASDICISTLTTHANYYAEFMEQAWEDIKSPRQHEALSGINADIENVRMAWHFYLEKKEAVQLWKIIHSLWYFYWVRWWNQPGELLFAKAVQTLAGDSRKESVRLRAQAMALQAFFMAWAGKWEGGYALAKECLDIINTVEEPAIMVFVYESLALTSYLLHFYDEFFEINEDFAKIAPLTGDKWLIAYSLFSQGLAEIIQEDFEKATQTAKTNLAIYEELGDVNTSTLPLIVLGHAANGLGNFLEAREYYRRCFQIASRVNFYYAIQTASKYLSKVCLKIGELEEAEEYLVQSLMISKDIGFTRDLVNLVYEYSRLMVVRGENEKAVELLTLVIQHPASQYYRMLEGRIRDNAWDLIAELESRLPPDQFTAAQECGLQLELDSVAADLIERRFN